MKSTINIEEAPRAIGPYSQAVKAGNMLYISGQMPVVPTTNEVVDGGIENQTRQSLENIIAILQSEGLTADSVVKTTVFVKNMDDFQKMNTIYGKYFLRNAPARACVEVARLPKDVLVEIEAIAAY